MFWKNPKILIWVFFIVMSVILIGPKINPSGYVVTHVGSNSSLAGIVEKGDIIYSINGEKFNQAMLEQQFTGDIKITTNKIDKFVRMNGTLGIDARKVSNTNLQFGLDIEGGTRALIKAYNITENNTMNKIIKTLQTRINIYGLRESEIRAVGKDIIEISMSGGNKQELTDLLEKQGMFEAKIPLSIKLSDGKGVLKLKDDFTIETDNKTVTINGKNYDIGDDLKLDDIEFTIDNITDAAVNLTATVYNGDDILTVYFDPQRSHISSYKTFYRWQFSIQLSQNGAEKAAMVTKNIPIRSMVPGETERYLESKIYFYLDGKLVSSLFYGADLKGKVVTEVQISGSEKTLEDAKNERLFMQSILKAGALPVNIKLMEMEIVSPNLGVNFMSSAMLAIIIAILGVMIVAFIRYKKVKLAVPVVITSLSEVLIILGISVVIGRTIDLAAIAGIIAAVGTGIDSQIIILDQALRKEARVESLKEKIKDAFFIIFGAGGTTIGAMIPLMIIGFGMLRGFAIITTIGVLVGILITRPAFGVIVQKFVE